MASDCMVHHAVLHASEPALAFGLRRPRHHEPMAGGASTSSLMRIETDDGPWVLKATPLASAYWHGRMEDNFGFETALAEAGVPLPRRRPLRDATGGVWVYTSPSGELLAITAHEFVEGEPADFVEPLEICVPTALALAAALGRAHQITWRPSIPRTGVEHRPGPAKWAVVRDAARSHPAVADLLHGWWPMLDFAESVLRTPRTCVRLAPVHADANPHNVLRTATGICILDWSDGKLRDPQTELASALFVWGCDGDGRPREDLPKRMVRAYRDTGAPFEATDLTVFRGHLMAMVHWAYSLCQLATGLQPNDPRSPAWALAQLAATVLPWAPRWTRLPELLDHLRSA
jgi:Ser/Thr protein kinase RdoA (MazF antagonist)